MIASFLKHLEVEKRYSPHTIKSYENDLTQFINFTKAIYNTEDLSAIKAIHIRSWMSSLVEKGVVSRSINRKLSSLRSFIHFHLMLGNLEKDPTLKIQTPKNSKKLPSIIQEGNLEALFNIEEIGTSYKGLRDRLIIELLYSTGIRRSELINLSERDIDKSNSYIKVLGKGNKERVIPLSKSLLSKIDLFVEVKTDFFREIEKVEPWLMLTEKGKQLYPKLVYNIVKTQIGSVSTSQKRSPHILRHSFATHLMNNGADLNAVKELLGHSSLAATQVYTHNSIEKLKDIYKKTHPKGRE